ncbi:MAG: bifunctional 2-C-methyl-D-erythritol 4-phosphate cytidylyltransferase/2-C-methyl-D-erythritol 2,4-cyclodiphosphate synthase [Alphaproteobacteria bacterium]|nr:bifunctional 2-C-methyl-D-erythritol 4-phosphate cytidylyltransferase/2-C-methyl-D-erythritol 2,4-cyclodiphosphate synthase [Alphaproteobacteria bacterium]
MTVAAVIVAGGSGLRAGGERPKQYQLIGGRPVIWWTCKAFLDHPSITHVQCVIGEGHQQLFADATAGLTLPPFTFGGSTRQDSCRIGVEACAVVSPRHILLHDAARPFVSKDVIDHILASLQIADAVVPGLPVADTMKFAPGGVITKTIDRHAMWFVQTPQGFSFPKILAAHRKALTENHLGLTDDAAVAEAAGFEVHIVQGEERNKKLTTQSDIEIANHELSLKAIIDRPDIRMGQGIDFHIFEPGNEVTLCGVKIPHSHRLKGHSDADVALHAVTDAILGAIGEGDIGVHFPPSEKQWKDAPSSIFVEKAVRLLHARGGMISNIDITVLAEAPKISPHLPAMKAALAPLLHVTPDRIAIKATTTEKLGAIGRKEGMAAFATATVRLPL